jgi:hypothetical protein
MKRRKKPLFLNYIVFLLITMVTPSLEVISTWLDSRVIRVMESLTIDGVTSSMPGLKYGAS